MRSFINVLTIFTFCIAGGSALAVQEREGSSKEFFPSPYISVFEQLDVLSEEKPIRLAATCFKSGERTSGMNKICYYDCMGSTAAITISSVELCPRTINR